MLMAQPSSKTGIFMDPFSLIESSNSLNEALKLLWRIHFPFDGVFWSACLFSVQNRRGRHRHPQDSCCCCFFFVYFNQTEEKQHYREEWLGWHEISVFWCSLKREKECLLWKIFVQMSSEPNQWKENVTVRLIGLHVAEWVEEQNLVSLRDADACDWSVVLGTDGYGEVAGWMGNDFSLAVRFVPEDVHWSRPAVLSSDFQTTKRSRLWPANPGNPRDGSLFAWIGSLSTLTVEDDVCFATCYSSFYWRSARRKSPGIHREADHQTSIESVRSRLEPRVVSHVDSCSEQREVYSPSNQYWSVHEIWHQPSSTTNQ